MDFALDERTQELSEELWPFMHEHVFPAERVLENQVEGVDKPFAFEPPIKDELKAEARSRGLWNLFLPDNENGAGLTNLQYAPLAEITGWSPGLAPEALNCSAPDTGNMELLNLFGSPGQKDQWLVGLLNGEIRSCFSMTEPAVASSDASNIETTIVRDGDHYVINGRKWWTSSALRDRCQLIIVMGVTNPDADRHRRQSMILVPKDTPGVEIVRSTSVFGYEHPTGGGHAEIVYNDVRVPAENILGDEGGGFAVAQARLGPGRIHHCMRLLGQSERALDLMCRRVHERVAFGKPLAEQGVVQEWIAESRIEIEQARLLVLKTAWLMDTVGNSGARTEIAAIKVAVPNVAAAVIDRAIQAFGAAGVSEDFPLAHFWTDARYLRIGDGPDEVHKRSVARRELRSRQPAIA
ncbi:MAG: acyl-CoA dehydrogenase [Actinomycetia bacterium]|nr:acyl-CoA dehydrogenase [Actinomycetes bacterium]MCP4227165.1 acyl-CoA dehydrogenase [Actinomycetes bacterium]MCP5035903.1 acyl-CoA dehydrogenase [Actinomycetes bacterium]